MKNAIATRNDNNGNTGAGNFDAAEFKRRTGWSWSDAVDEAAEIQREKRIFGDRRRGNRRLTRRSTGRRLTFAERFERATGWSYGAALDMAAEIQRDRRLFGATA